MSGYVQMERPFRAPLAYISTRCLTMKMSKHPYNLSLQLSLIGFDYEGPANDKSYCQPKLLSRVPVRKCIWLYFRLYHTHYPTVFENHRKSLIQQLPKMVHFGEFFLNLKVAVGQKLVENAKILKFK